MKKFRLSIIVLISLALIALFMLLNNRNGTLRNKDNNFSIEDTSIVTKFFLADKLGHFVKVQRIADNKWILNDTFPVAPDMVEVMLKTFKSIDIKAPVAKSSRNTIIRLLSAKSVKTEIYQRVYRINLFNKVKLFPYEKLTRTYYVGDATMNNTGTFMLMEGSQDPYIIHIPGFKGFVNSRYSPLAADWRSHSIYKFRLPDIQSVKITYLDKPEQSFLLLNKGDRSFVLSSLQDNRQVMNYDTLKLIGFLGAFRNVNFESLIDDITPAKRDSLLIAKPTMQIELTDNLNKTHILKAWRRKADAGQVDMEGNETEWDMDRMYALNEDTNDLITIQYFVFQEIMVPLSWFKRE